MAEPDKDSGETGELEPRSEPVEDAMYEDMDAISDAAERALTSLQAGDVPAVQAQLDRIKQTADNWKDSGGCRCDKDNGEESTTPDMDDLML
jgi:hypothetical protein